MSVWDIDITSNITAIWPWYGSHPLLVTHMISLSSTMPVNSSRPCSDSFYTAGSLHDVGYKEQAGRSLNALNRDQKAFQWNLLIHRHVGHHIGPQLYISSLLFQNQHLKKVSRHSYMIRSHNLILHIHFPIRLVSVGGVLGEKFRIVSVKHI